MTPVKSLLHALGWQHAYAARRVGVSPSWMGYWCRGVNMRGNPCVAPDDVVDYLRRVLAAVDGVAVRRPAE